MLFPPDVSFDKGGSRRRKSTRKVFNPLNKSLNWSQPSMILEYYTHKDVLNSTREDLVID